MTVTVRHFHLLLACLCKYDGQHPVSGVRCDCPDSRWSPPPLALCVPRRPAGSRQVSERRPASGSVRSGFGLLPAMHGPIQARGGLPLTDVVQGKVTIITIIIIVVYRVFTKLRATLVLLVLRTLSLSPTAEVENLYTRLGLKRALMARHQRRITAKMNIFPPTPTVTFPGGIAAEEDVSVGSNVGPLTKQLGVTSGRLFQL